jgi:hypothetical protein
MCRLSGLEQSHHRKLIPTADYVGTPGQGQRREDIHQNSPKKWL